MRFKTGIPGRWRSVHVRTRLFAAARLHNARVEHFRAAPSCPAVRAAPAPSSRAKSGEGSRFVPICGERWEVGAIALAMGFLGALGAEVPDSVRVAAVQCPSVMGETGANLRNLTSLVRKAASEGARIVVTRGMRGAGRSDGPTTSDPVGRGIREGDFPVQRVAETVPGPSTRRLALLADELNIYLCAGLIEVASNAYYNAQVLISPQGELIAHHRKKSLWTPGDAEWCSTGTLPVTVVKTEFGNLPGLMICFDVHSMPPLLAQSGSSEVGVIRSAGTSPARKLVWESGSFGPNSSIVPQRLLRGHGKLDKCHPYRTHGRGCGLVESSAATARVLAMSDSVTEQTCVFADLALRRSPRSPRSASPHLRGEAHQAAGGPLGGQPSCTRRGGIAAASRAGRQAASRLATTPRASPLPSERGESVSSVTAWAK